MTIRSVAGDRLTAAELYAIWRIRDAVFAVEQRVDEEDVDGLDLLATTTHFWLADDAGLTSYARVYAGADGARHLGRVCTRRDVRHRGLSGRLVTAAHDRWPNDAFVISAQSYLEGWYAAMGYRRTGDDYIEAAIPHTPMERLPR